MKPFAVSAVVAMLTGVGAELLAVLVWLHLAIRFAHLVIYLRGGNAAKGGSVRTVLYVASGLVTLIIILVAAWAALT